MSKQSNLINASQDITVNSSGNVGIGTSPINGAEKLVVKGNLEAGNGNTADTYQGILIGNAKNSSASETVSFIDFRNNLKVPDSHIFAGHSTDGGAFLTFGTTPAGSRSTDRRVERMRISSAGVMTTPNQPLCSMNNGAAWLNMAANTTYGTGSSYSVNRGGFYAGLPLGGYGVTHVPATGLYRVTLQAYVAPNQPGRLNLRANQSSTLCFLQIPSMPTHTALTENIVFLNAGDFLDYVTDATMNIYHSYLHTFVTLEFLG